MRGTAYYGGGGGGGGGAVTSVFGRAGVVTAVLGDYAASLVSNDSGVPGATVKDALNTLAAAIPSVPVVSVFGRIGAVVAAAGDYNGIKITNDSGVAGATVKDALNTLNAAIDLTGARVVAGPANTFLAGGNSWLPLFNAPANPGDDGKVVRASAGNFVYVGGSSVGQMLNWNGSQWQAGVDFGALTPVTTDGFAANSGTGYLRLGLVSGSGAGVASAAAAGNIRGARGAAGFVVATRNNGDTADLTVITTDTTTLLANFGTTAVGGYSTVINSPSAGSVTLRAGSSTSQLQVTTNGVALTHATLTWGSSVVGPTLNQTTNSAANQTGQKLSVRAQACTGTGTCTGGDLDVGPGHGATVGGLGRLIVKQVIEQRLAWNETGISFYAATPVAQATRVGQAVDSTGGTASGTRTFVDVTSAGLADPVKVNNNFATLIANMWNPLETAIHNIGLTA